MYDILIQNAYILDGTGKDGFLADVAIQNGKIAKVAAGLSGGATTIDATGLTLTPGWIDAHSHIDSVITTVPQIKEAPEQGITFSVGGNCGNSKAPTFQKNTLFTVADFFGALRAAPPSIGTALFVGHNTLRRLVMGTENRTPTPKELSQMQQHLGQALDEGAIGLSFGLTYTPGSYADISELIALAQTAKEKGGLLSAHIRNEGDTLLEAVEEFITVAQRSGCRSVISHHKAAGRSNWGKVRQSLAMIDKANASGADLYVDVYPYCASRTSLSSRFLPSRFHPPGTISVLSLLDDAELCQTVKDWGKATWGDKLDWVLVTDAPGYPEYQGLTMEQIAEKMGYADHYDAVLALIRLTNAQAKACFFLMCREDICRILAHPRAMIGTDSSIPVPGAPYHPRLRGTFPRVLASYVRREQVTTLPEMIRKFTSLPAYVYGLTAKGKIAEGYDADLCLFDSNTITDTADYVRYNAPNKGLSYVIIGGQITVKDNCYTGTCNAKPFLRK